MPKPEKPRHEQTERGQLIRDARKEMRLTQAELAKYVHRAYSTIRGWETQKGRVSQELVDVFLAAADNLEKEAGGDSAQANGHRKANPAIFRKLGKELQPIHDREQARKEESVRIDVRRGAGKGIRRRRPIRGNAEAIAGEWCAMWQTSRHGSDAVVRETVEITAARAGKGLFEIANRSDGQWVELQQPDDDEAPEHFLWEGSGGLFHQSVSGHFASLPGGPHVTGAFHLKLDNFQESMTGAWVGISQDSESTVALLVLGRNEKVAKKLFISERDSSPMLPLTSKRGRNEKHAD